MSTDLQAEIIQRHFESIQRVYSLPHNTKIVEAHQQWLQQVQDLYQQSPSDLLTIVIAMIKSYQSASRISETTIHYIQPAQQIANLYRDQPEQRTAILQQLEHIIQLGEPLFERPHIYKDYASQGLSHIVEILKNTQELWDVQAVYHHGELTLPTEMLLLIDRYIDDLGPYCGLNWDEREPLLKEIRQEIVQKYPEEVFQLFMHTLQNEAYHHYWLSKKLFFVLMEQKDKRLNRPELLLQLLQNFIPIIKQMIFAKPFILHLIFSIEKIAKAKQLNVEIVDAMTPLEFERYTTQSIPRKRLLQIEEKIKMIAAEFRQQNP